MNNYQMFRKIQERDNIMKKYSNDTKEDLIDLIIEKDNIIDNLQSKINKAIEMIEFDKKDRMWDLGEGNIMILQEKRANELLDIFKEDK